MTSETPSFVLDDEDVEKLGKLDVIEGATLKAYAPFLPGQVLVLETDMYCTLEQVTALRGLLKARFPDNDCLILTAGLRLTSIISPQEADERADHLVQAIREVVRG